MLHPGYLLYSKFNSFEQLTRQDPTGSVVQYVWVGDAGELDQEAGETMLRGHPEVVEAVFLHVVSEAPSPLLAPPPKLVGGRQTAGLLSYACGRCGQGDPVESHGSRRNGTGHGCCRRRAPGCECSKAQRQAAWC